MNDTSFSSCYDYAISIVFLGDLELPSDGFIGIENQSSAVFEKPNCLDLSEVYNLIVSDYKVAFRN